MSSNIVTENFIRSFAIGRKNWLFVDTRKDAEASAAFYSLIETAKANHLDPQAYIKHIPDHIATADTLEKIDVLSWQNWKNQSLSNLQLYHPLHGLHHRQVKRAITGKELIQF